MFMVLFGKKKGDAVTPKVSFEQLLEDGTPSMNSESQHTETILENNNKIAHHTGL